MKWQSPRNPELSLPSNGQNPKILDSPMVLL